MDKHKVADIIAANTDALSQDQMIEVAKAIREPMWEWHIIFAYVMIVAFLIRIVYMQLKGIRFPNPFSNKNSVKERFHGAAYIYFYFLVAVSAFTGICLKFGLLDGLHKDIEGIHKWGLYLYPLFIVIHIAGVVVDEVKNKNGIVSKMIGGD